MRTIDVANGDADGLCALVQLRLVFPRPAKLITGLKRDIALLMRVEATAGDEVTVLDLSFERNREPLIQLLQRGVSVDYIDHHEPGPLIESELLRATIDTSPNICTCLLVDRIVGGRQSAWAVVGAFGDGLRHEATTLGRSIGLSAVDLAALQELGECLNYNAYGASETEVLIPPRELYRRLMAAVDPLVFARTSPLAQRLAVAKQEDLAHALAWPTGQESAAMTIRELPDQPWARRSIGALGQTLFANDPERAHLVLAPEPGGLRLRASVRAPLTAPQTAHEFCRRFGGGGRKVAGGIDGITLENLAAVTTEFARTYAGYV